jgi:hypothetical protein
MSVHETSAAEGTGGSVPPVPAESPGSDRPEQAVPADPQPAAPADQQQAAPADQQQAADADLQQPVLADPLPAAVQDPVVPAAPVATAAAPRRLQYAVDIVFCIDVTGSMTPIIDAVKANALRFYNDVQTNLTSKGKSVDELRVRVIAFRDLSVDDDGALLESSFYSLPEDQDAFAGFVDALQPQGGGDAPESGLEAVALAINSPWTSHGDRRRQVIVVWTDAPAHPLNFAPVPPSLASSVPTSFSDLTDLWEDPQGPVGASSKRLILFAPDGPGWSDISASWENVVHHPSQAGGGLSEVDYGTIVDSIGNSV